MSYLKTCLKSTSKAVLEDALDDFLNVAPIVQGREAVPEGVDEFGGIIPAQPAIGDTAYWYTFVLATFEIEAGSPIEYADEPTVTALCGEG